MRFLLVALLLVTTAVTGCASNTASKAADDSEVDEHDAAALRSASALEGNVAVGSSMTVSYEHGEAGYPRTVPYLAVEIRPDSSAASELQEITVQGQFPGTPRILIVDDKFKVVARSSTSSRQADGTSIATVLAPRSGTRLVLVRDSLWSKSMTFDVRVGR